MSFTCLVTGESLRTDEVRKLWPKREDFILLRKCDGASVILWKPVNVAFGVRNLKIELMSRDPNQIIKLMCEELPKTTPGAERSETPELATPRAGVVGTPPPPTGPR
jgi:hypothetical protein